MPHEAELQAKTGELPEGELALAARTLVEERLRSIRRGVARDVAPGDIVLKPSSPEARRHLFEEACELYWNELSWEEISEEELVGAGEMEFTDMVFPGLLAFVDALLPRGPNGEPDRDREHRDVAHDVLLWLAGVLVELRRRRPGEDGDHARLRRQIALTDDLIDLVCFRLYSLTPSEIEAIREP